METGLYIGHGVAKQKFGPHPITNEEQYFDEFYVTKPNKRQKEDALKAAKKLNIKVYDQFKPSLFEKYFEGPTNLSELSRLRKAQEMAFKYFQDHCSECGYDTFTILGTYELLKEGESLEQASRCDVVRFYYKKSKDLID